ncbi:MAG: O-antigen ligase family protein [Candidatus Acidoferrales bacterium]
MRTANSNRWDRLAALFLLLFAAALPHSIALAQTAAALAVVVWLAGRLFRRERPAATLLDAPILLFLFLTFLAAVFSLEPRLSLTKLDGAGLILLVAVTANLVTSRRLAVALALVLLTSGGVSAAVEVSKKIAGQGVDVVTIDAKNPLGRRLQPRDVLLSCDGEKIKSPEHFNQVLAAHDLSRPLHCRGMRGGVTPFELRIPAHRLPGEPLPEAWSYQVKTGRGIRARGTYSHFVTYAEVMLQLAALACGLWIAYPRKASLSGAGLALLVILLIGALAATFTRASLAALVVALLAMAWTKVGRWARLAALPLAALALVGINALLIQWRGVGFYNPADPSFQYRRLMWEDGWRLIQEYPWLGVGMDTIVVRWQELGLRAYEQMELHGHFHSSPVQIAVERGLLGLAAWLLLMALYGRVLLRLLERTRHGPDWWSHGLALGISGATVAFLTSSLVHYNFGDSEVVMVFWLLAGVALALERIPRGVPLAQSS